MINAHELRIGNIVLYKGKETYILLDDLVDITVSPEAINYYEPIPLTEELLLKCGVDNGYTIDIKCKRKKISFSWSYRVVSSGKRYAFICKKYPHIKYLHQLQNLYFVLTGKELFVDDTIF